MGYRMGIILGYHVHFISYVKRYVVERSHSLNLSKIIECNLIHAFIPNKVIHFDSLAENYTLNSSPPLMMTEHKHRENGRKQKRNSHSHRASGVGEKEDPK